MNTFGVILSFCCLCVALIELRLRSDLAGRRMGAMLATAAWATMGCVALDQARRCSAMPTMLRPVTSPAKQIVAEALRDQWKYEAPDGGVITFESAAQAQARFVGNTESRASNNDRL